MLKIRLATITVHWFFYNLCSSHNSREIQSGRQH